jgi:hypothetical protein
MWTDKKGGKGVGKRDERYLVLARVRSTRMEAKPGRVHEIRVLDGGVAGAKKAGRDTVERSARRGRRAAPAPIDRLFFSSPRRARVGRVARATSTRSRDPRWRRRIFAKSVRGA